MQHFKLRLFFFSFIICVLTLSSCTGGDEDINNDKLRNSDYVFYKEEGKPGYWQKISEDSDFNYTKGTLTYFFDNGNLFGEVEIVDDYSNRIVKFYDKKSDKLISTEWIEGDSTVKILRENGYFERYYTNNGIVISEGKMQNNFEQGIWKIYNGKDGSLQEINEFKNGLVKGECKEFWKNGNLKSLTNWKKGIQNGESLFYYENGNLKEKYSLKNQEYHGPSESYYENGFLESSKKYWQGNTCDTNKSFYETGTLEKLQVINLDTLTLENTGTEFRYYPNGELEAELIFKNFQLHGAFIRYYENGNILEKSNKLKGKLNGHCIKFFDSGVKEYEGSMSLGTPNGNFHFYNRKGALEKSITYDQGIAMDSIVY